ncbi:MAG: hypothetical protein K2X47_08355, partial [Bdellovibrionales bacterium]|nr:hypothetical protein [Bdellovibrionales bacterium]
MSAVHTILRPSRHVSQLFKDSEGFVQAVRSIPSRLIFEKFELSLRTASLEQVFSDVGLLTSGGAVYRLRNLLQPRNNFISGTIAGGLLALSLVSGVPVAIPEVRFLNFKKNSDPQLAGISGSQKLEHLRKGHFADLVFNLARRAYNIGAIVVAIAMLSQE